MHQFNAIKVKTKLLLETVDGTYMTNTIHYTRKINENHIFIKRKQGEYFGGMLIPAEFFLGMVDIPDIYIYMGSNLTQPSGISYFFLLTFF